MASPVKLTDKTALTEVGSGDFLHVVDISDTTSSSAGTSKKLEAGYLIHTKKTTIINSDVQKLKYNNTPVAVCDAPPTGHIAIPLRVFLHCYWDAGATQESSSDNLYFGYLNPTTNKPISLYYYYLDYKNDLMNNINTSASGSRMWSLYSTGSSQFNSGISFGVGTTIPILNSKFGGWSNDSFNGGWNMDVYCTYQFLKIA